jgi:hypothetical protein
VELGSGQLERLNYAQRERTQWILPPHAVPSPNGDVSGAGEEPVEVTLTFEKFDTQHGFCCLSLTLDFPKFP